MLGMIWKEWNKQEQYHTMKNLKIYGQKRREIQNKNITEAELRFDVQEGAIIVCPTGKTCREALTTICRQDIGNFHIIASGKPQV